MILTIFTDGGVSGGNKEDQPCYCAFYSTFGNNDEFASVSQVDKGTSNQAEYRGLLLALEYLPSLLLTYYSYCKTQDEINIEFKSDSKIMINQVNGSFKTKDPKLVILRDQVLEQIEDYTDNVKFVFTHVKRELNPITDLLCNLAKKNIIKTNPFQSLQEFKQQHNLEKYKALKDI